jgi:ADP-heptose:LPS heptosyltransferase
LVGRGVTPVFLLGPQEGDVEALIREAAPGAMVLRADPAASRAEGLDLLIAEGQRFAALLANDNGVGHLLGAAGVPVVSLFGPTDPARWAPVAPANRVLKASDFGGGTAIEAIPVEAVVEAVMAMVGRGAAAPLT